MVIMSYVLLVPSIESASISPNPVNANTAYLIAVLVTEIEKVLEPTIRYCGTFVCGEEGIE